MRKYKLTEQMIVVTALAATITAALIGVAWSFALKTNLLTGLCFGGLIGSLLGIMVHKFLQDSAQSNERQIQEAIFIVASFLSLLAILGFGSSLVAFVIRLVLN